MRQFARIDNLHLHLAVSELCERAMQLRFIFLTTASKLLVVHLLVGVGSGGVEFPAILLLLCLGVSEWACEIGRLCASSCSRWGQITLLDWLLLNDVQVADLLAKDDGDVAVDIGE